MNIRATLVGLLRRWALVIAVTVIVVAGAVVATLLATPQYKATSSVYFALPSGTSGSDLFQGGNYAQQQAVGYAELVGTPTVLEPVIKQLGLSTSADDLAGGIVVASTLPNTAIVNIDVSSPSPQQAADIANATAQQLGVVVRQLVPRDGSNKPAMDATTIRQAVPPTAPSSPKLTTNVAAALVAGFLIAVGLDLLGSRVPVPSRERMRSGRRSSRAGMPSTTSPARHTDDPRPVRGPGDTAETLETPHVGDAYDTADHQVVDDRPNGHHVQNGAVSQNDQNDEHGERGERGEQGQNGQGVRTSAAQGSPGSR